MARRDQHATQIKLRHRALKLAQMLVAATGNGGRERHDPVLVLIAQAREIVVAIAQFGHGLLA